MQKQTHEKLPSKSELNRRFELVTTYILDKSILLYPIIKLCDVYASYTAETSYTDGKNIVLAAHQLNQPIKDSSVIFLHEVAHVLLQHPYRGKQVAERLENTLGVPKEFTHLVANAVADAISNYVISDFIRESSYGYGSKSKLVTYENLENVLNMLSQIAIGKPVFDKNDIEQIKKLPYEAAIEYVVRKIWNQVVKQKPPKPGRRGKRGRKGRGGFPVPSKKIKEAREELDKYEGSNDIRDKVDEKDIKNGEKVLEGTIDERTVKDPNKLREEIRDIIQRSKILRDMMRRTAGTVAGVIDRLFEILKRERVDWRKIFRNLLTQILIKGKRPTWSRVSKKFPFKKPGYKPEEGEATVWFLVDTSGSIGEEELSYMMTEAYNAVRTTQAKLNIIPWDATAYGVIEVRSPNDFERVKRLIKGGGGTVISPALKIVAEKIQPGDVVVIASDFEIFDIGDSKTKELFDKIARKASKIVFLTVFKEPPDYMMYHPKALPPINISGASV